MAAARLAAQSFMLSLPSKLGPDEEELIELLDQVGQLSRGFLPPSVTLQDWAEQRVPASDVARVNASGLVHVRSKATKLVTEPSVAVPPKGPPPHIAAGLRPSRQHVATGNTSAEVPLKRRRFNNDVFDIQAFLQELPPDEFSPHEGALRLEIIKHMFRVSRGGVANHRFDKPAEVARVAEAPCVKVALEALLLPATHLQDWMQDRVGNEFLVSEDENGNAVVTLEQGVKFPHRGTDEQEHISAEFFSSLPSESFSSEEENMRDVIRGYIDGFTRNGFPTLSTMCQDAQVGTTKRTLLPNGVSLKEWIEKRCGEDFDLVLNRSNQTCIGHAGTLDSDLVEMSRMERQPGSSRYNAQRKGGKRGKGKGKGAKR